jgi:spermidine synthase
LAVAVSFAANGFAALAYEVVWTRMLISFVGTSIYAFSIVLAEVLLGMMLGSYFIGKYVDRWRDPLAQFARLQLAAGLVIALVLHAFSYLGTNPLGNAVVLLSPILLGVLWGCTFSAAARCYVRDHSTVGRGVGQLYAWNTVGCIAGAAASGFILIPLLGAGRSAIVLAAINLVTCVALLAVHARGRLNRRWVVELSLVATGVALLATAGDPYYELLRRRMEAFSGGPVVVYRHVEEAAGTTTAFSSPDNDRLHKHLWVNGQGMTALVTVTKLMAHLPIWLSDDPHDALVICFGMGTTVRSASRYEGLDVSAVELAPGVLASRSLYHEDMRDNLWQPNVHAHVDDGRNYLLMHRRQYDVITIDPAPPLYSAGIVNLYTREFFQLCKERTRAGGVVCLWIPPDSRSEVEMIARTFLDVFEHVSAWSGPSSEDPVNDGLILIGSRQRIEHVSEKIDRGFRAAHIAADLAEWGTGCDQPRKIQDLFVADEVGLRGLFADTKVISDDRPYTEFYLWRSILDRSKYDELLTGSDVRQRAATKEQSP